MHTAPFGPVRGRGRAACLLDGKWACDCLGEGPVQHGACGVRRKGVVGDGLAAAYGHEMDKGRLKELGACVGGAFLCRTLARELAEFIPILGWLIKPGIAYGGTAALGLGLIEYFEGGEDVTGVAAVVEKATKKGTKLVSRVRSIASDPSSIDIAGTVNTQVSYARKKAGEYAPIVADAVSGLAQNVAVTASAISEAVAEGVSR